MKRFLKSRPAVIAGSATLVVGAITSALLIRRARRYNLVHRNALVTGGSRGLGLEIARVLVERGASVAIVARDQAEIERALGDLRSRAKRKNRVVGVVSDLTNSEGIEEMLGTVQLKLGPIDVLVNNAGMIQVGPLDTMTVDDFENEMKLHFSAPLRTMLGVRDGMRRRGGGRIANIVSLGGAVPVPLLLPYSASKFALMGLSQGMHTELARDGIAVSTIVPGLMRTGSPLNAEFKGHHELEHSGFALFDSMPFLSMPSDKAARQIVAAIEYGTPYKVLGVPAKVATLMNAIFPNLVARGLKLINSFVPNSHDQTTKLGRDAQTWVTKSVLTWSTQQAALRNNEC